MFVETVKSDGLAHLSYLVGDGDEAAVIDPRRDCALYIERAAARGCRITRIFETHRNEDLVTGSAVLAERTGATVHHGPHAADHVRYAQTVREGEHFDIGSLRIGVLETPGHTDDSVSYVMHDTDFDEGAVGVFTGDALFVGDVGRTDFYPDRAAEVAGLLFDSLRKLLALGDQAIIYPAHGAGSVCGDNMADREFSTLGHERRNNPMLAIDDREAFIARKRDEHHYQPPYFRDMEAINLQGGGAMPVPVTPPVLGPGELPDDAIRVDVRGTTAFLGGHLPDSLSLPVDMLAAFAGWLLDADDRVLLIADDEAQATEAARSLGRIGYDHIAGCLTTALPAWTAQTGRCRSVPVVDAGEVARRVNDREADWTLLDVRSLDETGSGVIPGARTIYVGELPSSLGALDRSRRHTIMCASGARATIAASILLRAGFEEVDVFLGSMGAWRQAGHDVETP